MNSLLPVFARRSTLRHLLLVLALVSVSATVDAKTRRPKHRTPPPTPTPVKPSVPLTPTIPTTPTVNQRVVPSNGGGAVVQGNRIDAAPTVIISQGHDPLIGNVSTTPIIAGLGQNILTGALDKSAQGAELLRAWVIEDKVTTEVPYGIKRVAIQRSTTKGWKTVATSYVNGNTQSLSVTIPETAKPSELRVLGYRKSKFTATQVASEFDFTWNENGNAGATLTKSGGGLLLADTMTFTSSATVVTGNLLSVNNAVASTTVASTATTATTTASTTTTATPVAVESDIWKVIGNRLFFFNQYRGLQVFDLTDPVHPVKLGSLRMAAKGEFFYSLDDAGTRLALLTRNDSNDTASGYSAIKILAVSSAGVPTLVTSIPVPGYLGESRLIGSRLYVVETYWREALAGGGFTYHWNDFRIHGFDLTDPSAPVDLGSAAGTGYAPVLEAAGDYLLASTSQWIWDSSFHGSRSRVHAFNISGDGTPRLAKVVTPQGTANDQFKLSVRDHYLLTATLKPSYIEYEGYWWDNRKIERVENANGTDTLTVTWTYGYTYYPSQTWIESFDLNDNTTNDPVAKLPLDAAQGEALHATRFDGSRLYVVTFGTRVDGPISKKQTFTIVETVGRGGCDPLFIIDISNPANPVLHGQLEIPGWSNFVYPNGDRLFAVGRQDNQIAVSYYDVANIDSPKEISRVLAGDSSHYAWSESEYDHRAVTYLPEQGKAFVPFQQWDNTGYQSAMQVVNVTHEAVTLGPVIQQTGTARRGTKINGHLVSISGRQMVVASDPAVGESKEEAWIELSWPVDRVLAVGDYLVQIEDGNRYGWWGYSYLSTLEATVRISSRNDPDFVLDSVNLGSGQVVAAEQRGDMIYLAQTATADAVTSTSTLSTSTGGKLIATPILSIWRGYNYGTPASNLRTWSLRIQNNKIQQAGSTLSSLAQTADTSGYSTPNVQATQGVWLTNSTLTWHVPMGNSYYNWGWLCIADTPAYGNTIALTGTSAGIISIDGSSSSNTAPQNVIKDKVALPDRPCAIECPVMIDNNGVAQAQDALVITMPGNGDLYEVGKPISSNGYLFFSSRRGGPYPYYWGYYLNYSDANGDSARSTGRMLSYGEYACSLHVIDFTQSSAGLVRDPAPLPGMLLSTADANDEGAWLITERLDSKQHKNGNPTRVLQTLAYDGVKAHRVDQLDTNENYFTATAGTEGMVFCAINRYLGYDSTYISNYESKVLSYRLNTATGALESLTPWMLSSGGSYEYIGDLRVIGNHLMASGWGNLHIAKINPGNTLTEQVATDLPSSWWFNVSRAVIDTSGLGVWMPMGDYGVQYSDLK